MVSSGDGSLVSTLIRTRGIAPAKGKVAEWEGDPSGYSRSGMTGAFTRAISAARAWKSCTQANGRRRQRISARILIE